MPRRAHRYSVAGAVIAYLVSGCSSSESTAPLGEAGVAPSGHAAEVIPLAPPAHPVIKSWPLRRAAGAPEVSHYNGGTAPLPVRARLLVLCADGSEATLPAIRQTLDFMGTPYDVLAATTLPQPDPAAPAADAYTRTFIGADNVGNYQGVILTTGELGYAATDGTWKSAFSAAQWQGLWDYEGKFGVRQVTLYTFPTPDLGFNWGTAVSTEVVPIEAAFTDAGKLVFPYANTDKPVVVRGAYTFLATPFVPTDASTNTPLHIPASHRTRQLAQARLYQNQRF